MSPSADTADTAAATGSFTRPVWWWGMLVVLAGAMISIGVGHFADPTPFDRIVPPPLPPRAMTYLSGFFEVLGGVGLLVPRTRRWAAMGLIALFIAVFPANIYMAIAGIQLDPANPMPTWIAWARLPFQALFIAWAYAFVRWPQGRPN